VLVCKLRVSIEFKFSNRISDIVVIVVLNVMRRNIRLVGLLVLFAFTEILFSINV
jgi:hypothetical protein